MTFRFSNQVVPCVAAICLLASVARAQSVADDRVAPGQNHQPGVSLEVFEGLPGATATNDDPTATVSPDTWAYLPIVLDGQTPNVSVVTDKIFVGDNGIAGYSTFYVAEFTTQLLIDEPGEYQFMLTSDDGSRLSINGEVIIDHGLAHAMTAKTGVVELDAGPQALRVSYFQGGGGQGLTLTWQPPGSTRFTTIPTDRFRTEAGLTRVISDGPKRMAAAGRLPRPGDGRPLTELHPMWKLTTISTPLTEETFPEVFEPKVAGMDYLGDGKLVVAVFNARNAPTPDQPNGKLYLLEGVDGPADIYLESLVDLTATDLLRTPEDDVVFEAWIEEQRRKRREAHANKHRTDVDPNAIEVSVHEIADGFFNPLGVLYHEGALFVADRDAITKLTDTDGDGSYETREVFADGWTSDNYHHFTFGPVYLDGHLYAGLSVAVGAHGHKITKWPTRGGSPNGPHRGSVMKIDLETREIEWIAGGLRTPNGFFVHDGQVFVGENQGTWMPSNKINHIQPGNFYGHYNGEYVTSLYPDGTAPSDFDDQVPTPPAVYLVNGEIANSPSAAITLPDGPFAGHLLVSDVKAGGLRRVVLEKVNGVYQGVALRHTQGFDVGLNRLALGDDGHIYVGGIGERRGWSWKRTQQGLQRLEPTGETTFEIHDVAATPDGLRVRFTEPVDFKALADASNYEVQQWFYRPTAAYGGRKFGVERLPVTATPSADGMSVDLALDGMKHHRVIHLRANVPSAAGEPLWSPEAWYTMNQIPGTDYRAPENNLTRVAILTETQGFRHGNIEFGIEVLRRICKQNGIDVFVTNTSEPLFEDGVLETFDAVVFFSTTGNVLNTDEQTQFEGFIRAGGGFMGIHAATDTEYEWDWYRQLVGGQFDGHPKVQPAVIDVLDHDHPSTAHLDEQWERTDEWYNFKNMSDQLRVLLALDESTYQGGTMGEHHPIAWYQEFDGGRAWYTGGGHTNEAFEESDFIEHLAGGLRWVTGLED
ncbi:MAG: ThuA domain-containing protein [Planctomycetota bacterium]